MNVQGEISGFLWNRSFKVFPKRWLVDMTTLSAAEMTAIGGVAGVSEVLIMQVNIAWREKLDVKGPSCKGQLIEHQLGHTFND
jgi:hypothetical protein